METRFATSSKNHADLIMIKAQKTLILYCDRYFQPSEAIFFHIIQKFLISDNKKEYISFNVKDLLTLKWFAIRKEKSVFRRRLYSMRSNAHLFLFLITTPIAIVLCLVGLLRLIVMSYKIKKDHAFFEAFLLYKILGVQIGDCASTVILRSTGSKGYLRKDLHFYKTISRFYVEFYLLAIYAKSLAFIYKDNMYFYAHDTVYLADALRRVLLSYGFREIRYDGFKSEVVIIPPLYGYEILQNRCARSNIEANNLNLEKASIKLKDFVYRNITYSYMVGSDVDLNSRLNKFDLKYFEGKRVAVIFLHQISDGQYIYGTDCFIDLHDWLIQTLDLLAKRDICVALKMHPNYFNQKMDYPVDRAYLKVLEDEFNISLGIIDSCSVSITNRPNVYFLHHSLSIVELDKYFPTFLCVTHHGTVAIEAAFLGHSVIVSSASLYLQGIDKFVHIYNSYQEYEKLIIDWYFEVLMPDLKAFNSLLIYVYTYYFLFKQEENVFEKIYGLLSLSLFDNSYNSMNDKLENIFDSISENDKTYTEIEILIKQFVDSSKYENIGM